MSELPKGWVEIPLDDLAAKTNYPIGDGDHGQIRPSEYRTEGIPYIRVSDLGWGKFFKDKLVYISNEVHQKNQKSKLLPGDILIAKTGATLGKCCIVPDDISEANTTSSIGKVTIDKSKVLPKWILYFFLTKDFYEYLWSISERTAQPGFNNRDLKKFIIPLAPLDEQKRIVEKLDKLLDKVEESKARLEKIPGILKRFRQSVLNAATSGLLTKDYRKVINKNGNAQDLIREIYKKRNSSSEKQPDNLIIRTGYDIPEGWVQTNISNICVCLDSRRRPVNKIERSKRKGNIPYYGANGQVDTIDGYLFDEDLVCVVEDETFIGREIPFSYIIKGKSWVNNHAHVLKPDGGISVDYLNILLSYYNFTPLTSGTTGRRKLNQGALMSAIVTLAPINEQVEIVKRVKALLRKADEIEERYKKAKCHIDKITQSILAKAFRGELVPQDD